MKHKFKEHLKRILVINFSVKKAILVLSYLALFNTNIVVCQQDGSSLSHNLLEAKPVGWIISNYGGAASVGDIHLEWSMGEPLVGSNTKPEYLFTQGFHQPLMYAISSVQTSTAESINADKIKIVVYPNPVTTILNVQIDSTKKIPLVLELFDSRGRLLKRENSNSEFDESLIEFSMSNYPKNMYLLTITDNKGQRIKTFKILKLD